MHHWVTLVCIIQWCLPALFSHIIMHYRVMFACIIESHYYALYSDVCMHYLVTLLCIIQWCLHAWFCHIIMLYKQEPQCVYIAINLISYGILITSPILRTEKLKKYLCHFNKSSINFLWVSWITKFSELLSYHSFALQRCYSWNK